MKKLVVCALCLYSLFTSVVTVSAQERNDSEQPSAELPILQTEKEKSTLETFSLTETNEEITGVFGTVSWTFEEETGALTFGGGEFPKTHDSANIKYVIERNSIFNSKTISKIIFTEPIKAHSNSNYLFARLDNLQTIENIDYLDTSDVTNMNSMFSSASSLTSLDLSDWNTSNVTDMDCMFSYAYSLTNLDVSNWDTSNVKDMGSMFDGNHSSNG